MDRESRDPFDLLDEIEKTLALDTAPVTWPIGRGRDFLGTLNLADGGVRLIEGDAAKTGVATRMSVAEMAKLNPNLDFARRWKTNSRWCATPATSSIWSPSAKGI